MIYQISHQHKKTGVLTLVGQSEDISNEDQMREWEKSVAKDWPLPDGHQWLICNTKSKYFDNEAILMPIPGK